MSDLIEDAKEAISQATSEDSFDALAFFSGSALPEDTVTLYADMQSAYRLAEIKSAERARKVLNDTEGISLTDEVEYTDEDEVDELTRALEGSAVVFKLRGLAPAARSALEKSARAKNPYTEGAENPEYNEAYNGDLIASTIVSVTNAKGKIDTNKWDRARVLSLAENIDPSQFDKLYSTVFRVNFIGDAIDVAISADF